MGFVKEVKNALEQVAGLVTKPRTAENSRALAAALPMSGLDVADLERIEQLTAEKNAAEQLARGLPEKLEKLIATARARDEGRARIQAQITALTEESQALIVAADQANGEHSRANAAHALASVRAFQLDEILGRAPADLNGYELVSIDFNRLHGRPGAPCVFVPTDVFLREQARRGELLQAARKLAYETYSNALRDWHIRETDYAAWPEIKSKSQPVMKEIAWTDLPESEIPQN